MPNKPEEDRLVKDAMNQLSVLYGDYLIGNHFALMEGQLILGHVR